MFGEIRMGLGRSDERDTVSRFGRPPLTSKPHLSLLMTSLSDEKVAPTLFSSFLSRSLTSQVSLPPLIATLHFNTTSLLLSYRS